MVSLQRRAKPKFPKDNCILTSCSLLFLLVIAIPKLVVKYCRVLRWWRNFQVLAVSVEITPISRINLDVTPGMEGLKMFYEMNPGWEKRRTAVIWSSDGSFPEWGLSMLSPFLPTAGSFIQLNKLAGQLYIDLDGEFWGHGRSLNFGRASMYPLWSLGTICYQQQK